MVKPLAVNGIFASLTFAATMFINVRLPVSVNGGLIHLGNIPLVVAAIVFGPYSGAAAGAVGMGLFDVVSGWAAWAPGTIIIRGLMGFVIGFISERKPGGRSAARNAVAVSAGGAVMIAGYYLYEVMLTGNPFTPLTSIPGNALQLVTALILGVPLATAVSGAVNGAGRRARKENTADGKK
jgi:uncharacterized membrane protein